ncbi:RNase H [Clostridium coskatii]|uniref:RNase H n=1 Tax=Clostridium coskatii TaxID=1705578 RepID=A0A166SVE2_9CLOT|nr:RNase H [Clostridium coskatii]OBR92134.1 RNase H [Clostridium coskatii]
MVKKVYAIKEGYDFEKNEKVQNIIVNTWGECLKRVKGVKGATYKSFKDTNSALEYLKGEDKILKKSEGNYPKDCLHVYVDGSYNISTEMYSYALVAVKGNVVYYIESDSHSCEEGKNIRQISGELKAAVRGVQYALSKGEKKVVLFHDYEGTCKHALGLWERKEASSIKYYEEMSELMKNIEVIFVKVDSHTGDLFNELADEKCKEKLQIESKKSVQKWLMNNEIKTANDEVKNEILKIASKGEKNIKVIDI